MKLKIFFPIAAAVLLLVGAGLLAVILLTPNNDFVKDITLKDNDITSETLNFSANGLKPGDEREYTLNINGKSAGSYKLYFDFVESQSGALKDFVNVTLLYGDKGETYALSDLLNGAAVCINCNVGVTSGAVIKVIYSMPIGVGNEAQNATTDFAINLTAAKS